MTGHALSHPIRTLGAYTARCQCGLNIWGHTLPRMWRHHDIHLRVVRAMGAHP